MDASQDASPLEYPRRGILKPCDADTLVAMKYLIIFLAAALASCTAPKVDTNAMLQAPQDFGLEVVVHAAQNDEHARPARFTVGPDASLRAAFGPAAPTRAYQPIVRRLTRRNMDQLWRLVRDSGLIDQASPAKLGPGDSAEPAPGRPAAIVRIQYSGRYEALRIYLDRAGEDADAAFALIERLELLAWRDK